MLYDCRSLWPRCVRQELLSSVRALGSWVRITFGRMDVCVRLDRYLFILTVNWVSPGGSGTTIRHNTQTTHITQNNTTVKRNTVHKNTHTMNTLHRMEIQQSQLQLFCLFCVYVVLSVGSGLAAGCSPVQGVLPTVYILRNWNSGQGPTKGL
jgi:hypothetical protein